MNKRILFYTPIFPPEYSGATFQAIALAKQLQRNGHDITFLCLRESETHRPPGAFDTLGHEGLKVIEVPIQNYREPYTLKKHGELVLRLFHILFSQRKTFDIIHSHNFQFPYAALGVAGRLLRKPSCCKVTMSADLDYEKIGRATGSLYSVMTRSFDRVIGISSEITSTLRQKGFADSTIESIPNGVDTDRFHPVDRDTKREIKHSLGQDDRPVVLFLGGITYRKGVDDLMTVWKTVADHNPEATLLLLGPRSLDEGASGDAYCYDEAMDFIRENDLEERVQFLGRINDVRPYLQSADLLVLPSKLEGMPNVVLEAMACGTPCVANRVSGINDIITPGENGEIIDFDTDHFSRAIIDLLDSSDKRDKYGAHAASTIKTHFSLRAVAEQYARLYDAMQQR
ncbi:glycosyltransferase family 4 protein [Pseudodesulfovibrio profundus]|uniref:glycosyltransferase family 4 protein n=1 Tax=Pseudodesulfovibrio profundus TaxID=57320 RepID=UPI001390595A|nr:glycosyltransferase family 4 protein [Pseudodesulfovibrio profundus]